MALAFGGPWKGLRGLSTGFREVFKADRLLWFILVCPIGGD